jgi:hypothetical protein
VETSDVLDTVGSLVSQLKAYAAKLPVVVPMSVVPGGIKPKEEAIEAFEKTVYRFRAQSGTSIYKRLNDLFIESLEAFEGGKLLSSIQPLLAVLDHLEQMQRDKEILASPGDEKRMGEYRAALHKILPGGKPELEGAGRGL